MFHALQGYQSIRENELSGEDVYNLLKHKKGEELSVSQKFNLAKHVKTLLEVCMTYTFRLTCNLTLYDQVRESNLQLKSCQFEHNAVISLMTNQAMSLKL